MVVDKHSTGGVGDKTTLAFLPLLAGIGMDAPAGGIRIAKLSGRGLGFTGGTIDKLEAIPGFTTDLPNQRFKEQVATLGMAISSQTPDLAPADGRMYTMRDVTATVQSIPLITASVMSKKIAAGAKVIVLDIKFGCGAFMETLEEARLLAEACREVGKRLGRHVSTVISSMEQPLGNAIGHTLEVLEVIALLSGKGPADLEALCLLLGAVALLQAGYADTLEAGETLLKERIQSGKALAAFYRLVEAQGGNPACLAQPSLFPTARIQTPIQAKHSGYVSRVDARDVARAAKLVGAGRTIKADTIDPAVGVIVHKKVSDAVQPGDLLATLHANADPSESVHASAALETLSAAFDITPYAVAPLKLIEEVVY